MRPLFALGLLLAAAGTAAAAEKIRISLDINSPPLSYVDEAEQPAGFTAELLQAMEQTGLVEFDPAANFWKEQMDDFTAGRLDALANVTITEDRRETMDFSISHASVHGVTYNRPGAKPFTHTAQFAGKTMGTLKGTIAHGNAVKNRGWGATIRLYDTWTQILEAVRAGECDFALLLRPLKFEQPDELGLKRVFVEDIIHYFHIAVHRGDRESLERINEALARVRHSGEFDRLYAKWIGPIEPHPIRLADLRPYYLPGALVVLLIAGIFGWQRYVNRRLAWHARALADSESKYRLLVENTHEAIFVVQDGVLKFANSATLRLSGLGADIIGRSFLEFVQPQDRARAQEHLQAVLTGHVEQSREEYQVALPAGRELWLDITSFSTLWQGRPATVSFAIDTTKTRQAESARQEAAERLQKIANRLPGFVYQFRQRPDGTTCYPYASDGIERIYRVRAAEVRDNATPIFALHHPDDLARIRASIRESAAGLTPWKLEYRVHYPDGTTRWLAGNAEPQREPDGSVLWHGFITDVTERKQADELIRTSLREKEALLQEVHHRVKNNLQVITSLLRLEAGKSAHPATKAVLQEMQSRIRSMALLHETLYRSGNYAAVDLADYLRQLATQLFRAQNPRPSAIHLVFELEEVLIGTEQAIPCGLIVNELLINALKHAFPGDHGGEVVLALQAPAAGTPLRLVVRDNGVGLPADLADRRIHSLGLQLVADLTRQLQGTLETGPTGPGAAFTIAFQPEPVPPASGKDSPVPEPRA